MASNKFKGKYQEGTFSNGEGPVLGQSVSREEERKGILNTDSTGSGRNLKTVGGTGELLSGTPSEKNFDLHSKSYAGPENWQPTNEGEQHPFEVNKNG